MKKLLILFLSIISIAYATPNQTPIKTVMPTSTITSTNAPIVTINKIAAWVNKSVVTSNQVDAQVTQFIKNQPSATNIPLNELKAKILEQLIMQKIQLNLAKRNGISTTDLEVASTIDNMAKSQNMTIDQLKAKLNAQNLTFAQFQDQVKDQLTIDKLKQREVDARISVNDDEVNRVLNSEAYKQQVDYNLSDILISLPEQATTSVINQKKKLANEAYNALATAPFSQVAIKYSDAPNGLSGGELGWKSNIALPPIILQAIKNANSQGITQVIQLPIGFFIFKVNGVRDHSTPQIVRQYHVKHILIKVNENTSDSDAHQKILSIYQRLKPYENDKAKLDQEFSKLAKEFSEDTSSINGGDIGWVAKGDTVPKFEETILKTPIGSMSEPIRTPFGWHILEVLGTRDSNLTNDRQKSEVRQEIRDNKASILYAQWLRDIRKGAYVKINNNQ